MIDGGAEQAEYDDTAIRFLEALWGEGYLSPGGPDEVDRVVDGLVARRARRCSTSAAAPAASPCIWSSAHGAAHVTGFDVEQPVIEAAQASGQPVRGLADRASFVQARPDRCRFADASFDVVFSKDALLHVPDKDALFAEIFRVLKPGGVFAAANWMIGA